MKKIILASTSQRRRELLKQKGYNFEIMSPGYDEKISDSAFKYEVIEKIAENKCISAILQVNEPAIIVSADTVVIYDDLILGKPKNFDDALRMLTMLKGKTHKVVTAVCVFDLETGKKIIKSETSEVTFNDIPEEKIKEYIFKFKPYDKAGSYGIQELPESFIKEIKGDYTNIVGLPVEMLKNMLDEITNI